MLQCTVTHNQTSKLTRWDQWRDPRIQVNKRPAQVATPYYGISMHKAKVRIIYSCAYLNQLSLTRYRRGITVKSLARGQEFPHLYIKGKSKHRKIPSDLIEDGNLQLWQRISYERSHRVPDGHCDLERRPSGASSPYPYNSSLSFSASSIISNMSGAHTQQISLGFSRMAIQLTQPKPPLLVLYLKQPKIGQLSFLVIELDERTKIEPNSCNCRSFKKACAVSVLERSGTPLLARRFYAKSGLNSWNLAAIGEHWSSNNSESVQVQTMYWLRITFKSESERIKFNNNIADLIRIYSARMEDYQKDLKLIRGTHIISQAA